MKADGEQYRVRIKEARTRGREQLDFHPAYDLESNLSTSRMTFKSCLVRLKTEKGAQVNSREPGSV